MKQLSVILTVVSLLMVNLTFAKDATISNEKREIVRQSLVKTRDILGSVSDKMWESYFTNNAKRLRKSGKINEAEASLAMADPNSRDEVLELMDENIHNLQENGPWGALLAFVWTFIPGSGESMVLGLSIFILLCCLGDDQQASEI